MVELNPFGAYTAGRKLGMARRAEERLEEDRARAATTRNRLAEMLAGGMPATPEAKRAVVSDLARSDPGMALDWAKHFEKAAPDMLARRKTEAPFYVSELQGVSDQAGYDRARANLGAMGVDVSDMPDVYDPAQVNMALQASRYLAEGPAEAAGGPYRGTGEWAQDRNILITGDPRSPEYAASYAAMAQPQRFYDQNLGRMVEIQPDMSPYRPPASAGAPAMAQTQAPTAATAAAKPPEPMGEPGAKVTVKNVTPTKLTMAESQDLASFDQAKKDIEAAEKILFPDGKFSTAAAAAAAGTVVGTEGRTAAQALRRSIEVLLRLRTGAAAPKEEVDNYMGYYMPSPLDNQAQADAKRQALKGFFEGTRDYFSQGRSGTAAKSEAAEAGRTEPTQAGMAPSGNFSGMSEADFLNTEITEENAEAWNKEYERRMGNR